MTAPRLICAFVCLLGLALAPVAAEAPPVVEDATGETVPFDDYVGEYQISGGSLVAVTLEDGKLMGQARGQSKAELVGDGSDTFTIAMFNARVVFHRNEEGAIDSLTFFQGGRAMAGNLVERFEPSADELARYAGRYYNPELHTAYTLIVKDEKLVATHVHNGEIELTPTDADEFSGNRPFFKTVVFERDVDGVPASMLVSNDSVSSVRFERQ